MDKFYNKAILTFIRLYKYINNCNSIHKLGQYVFGVQKQHARLVLNRNKGEHALLLLRDLTPEDLDSSPSLFLPEAFFLRASGWFRRFVFFWYGCNAFNKFPEPAERFVPILSLASMLLSLDNDHAFPGDAMILQSQEPLLTAIG